MRLESRPPNIEGRGEVTIRDLVRNALRMRPDRIVVGEVRDAAALDMLQAMNTGHDGSICTVHSNGPRDTLARIETMVLMAGMDLPVRAIREQIASAVDLIVHQTRFKDGIRRITHITEVERMEGDVITLQDIFVFDHAPGFDADGAALGCCARPGCARSSSTSCADVATCTSTRRSSRTGSGGMTAVAPPGRSSGRAAAVGLGVARSVLVLLAAASGPRGARPRSGSRRYTGAPRPASAAQPPPDRARRVTVRRRSGRACSSATGGSSAGSQHRLDGAGSRFSPAEWLLLHAGIFVVVALVGLLLGGGQPRARPRLPGRSAPSDRGATSASGAARRRTAFDAPLPDTLQLMSGCCPPVSRSPSRSTRSCARARSRSPASSAGRWSRRGSASRWRTRWRASPTASRARTSPGS